ncbi:MAG: sulfite reductase subunit alpha [Cephaloticoccus sp.]|nr:sulfite reductase subunit alpha [Cephaloticoccus sp.]MCF7759769.1 sulfite reductase subunit alpha [Cephaloticoccus sp.]
MSVDPAASLYSKDNPFPALVTETRMLSKPGSSKDTRHFVINMSGSGLTYKTGDSLGVFGTNRQSEVDEIMALLGATGEEMVTPIRSETPIPLHSALSTGLDLDGPTRKTVEIFAAKVTDAAQKTKLEALLAPEAKEELNQFLHERNFVDFLAEYPSAIFTPQEFTVMLRRLMPRLYSIASSPRVYPNEIHLTIAVVRYFTNQRDRVGVCSTFLSDRTEPSATPVPVFVSHSHFGPPEDSTKDCIMVGPGTGIAPFRAFMQDRVALNAPGRNWVFFGDQKRATDYLYEEEWADYLARKQLHRLDHAWSRDQLMKIYVQDRMRENAGELWSWIKGGAHFYVCGDAKRMAKDVDAALHEIIAVEGGMDSVTATDYIKQMKKDKRYQRDVY